MAKLVADVVVETLEAAGVRNCYGVVGDTMNRFAHAVRASGIDFVHMRHEEAGGFAAGAEALYNHRLVACAGSCGPGSLHFINGLYDAHRNRAPVVLIATQLVRKDVGFESVQEVNFQEIYRSLSVYCEMILTPEQARRKTAMACQAALSRKGLAVIVLPADVADSKAAPELPFTVNHPAPVVRPSDEDLDKVAAILNASNKVTIYAGNGCEGAHDQIVELAAKLKAPVAHTTRGKDFVEYDNPYNVGMTGMIGQASGYHAVLDAEVLLTLGADFAWSQFYPDKARIIQVDIDGAHLGRRHPVEMGLVGDVRHTLDALLPRIDEHYNASFLDKYVAQHRKRREADDAEGPGGMEERISGSYLAKVINRQARDDALFAADDGTPLVWLCRHIESGPDRRTFGSLLHGTMASGMSSALGLQKSQPDRQVICLSGDGGFAMMMGDLLTTVQENLPIKICVFDNGKLGFVEIEQKASGLLPVYTDLKNPNFGKVAEAVGIWGREITHGGEVEEAVAEWLAQPGPALLSAKVMPMQLVDPPTPFVSGEAVIGFASYTVKAVLQGQGKDIWQLVKEN